MVSKIRISASKTTIVKNSYQVNRSIDSTCCDFIKLCTRGLKSFTERVEVYFMEEAQQATLESLNTGFQCIVVKLNSESEVLSSFELTMHRNSSAARFKLINGNNFLQLLNASFYKVTTRTIDGPVYLVAVFHNGSFAYTDPYFANHELHLPQIMSLFIAGNISINALFYYHP